MCDTSRITDRSRLVLAIADRRARDLGAKEASPEHLLFALAAEGVGIASTVLRRLGAGSEEIKIALSAGRIAKLEDFTDQFPWDSATKSVLAQSAAEARALNHHYVGTEHLILGLSNVSPGVFERAAINPIEIRSEVYSILGRET